jgi:hypothetical protein
MRENRTYGSEGGEGESPSLPYGAAGCEPSVCRSTNLIRREPVASLLDDGEAWNDRWR